MTDSKQGQDQEEDNDLDFDTEIPALPPDGGYGWVILVASFFCNVLVDGVCFSFGIWYVEFLAEYGDSKSKTAWVGSVLNGMYLTMGPVAGALSNRYGCRKVTIAGSIICAIAFALAIFSPSVSVLIIVYGALGGFGFGLMYLPAIVMVGFYFEKKRAFATGIAVCGSGAGAFVFAPLCKALIDNFAWRGGTLIVAGLVLNGCVLGALFRPLGTEPRKKVLDVEMEDFSEKETTKIKKPDNALQIVEKNGRDLDIKDISSAPVINMDNGSQNLRRPRGVSFDEPTRPATKSRAGPGGKPIPKILVQEYADKEHANGDSSPTGRPHHVVTTVEEINASPVGSQTWRISQSSTSIRSHLQRPMYRKDIFYSGSILHLPEYQQSTSVEDYIKSTTSLPPAVPRVEPYLCRFIPESMRDILMEMMDFSLLKLPPFTLYGICCFFSMVGFFIPFTYLPDYAQSVGVPGGDAVFLLSIIGISNTVGRIASGWVCDHAWANSLVISNVALIVGGTATMLVPLCTTHALLAVYSTVFGLCIAAYISLRSIILVELLGLDKLTNAFGLITLCQGLASFIGSPIAGGLYDATGSYTISFVFGGATLAVSGVLCFPLYCYEKCCMKKGEHQAVPGEDNGDAQPS
ncbi:monocarboxylate transporter 13 [Lingula anatina]|uniref:Monocarboxylate transporter 13 n=1 Tax=Lingula anatina TaxID=7574 RepID=A0A1S3IPU6_LINAN|nr:monocarboxylate transporter 13 [Lingula anatina]XP_013399565.1 monocarboxylate transporter 13 [Lingula anatina]XP_013399566.1 monocarboxylate transporter 13 [Lingula anatina]|eukprot:XP_013399564.1 monocarboxylate transporter 13 [Lingula anatina]